MYSYGGRMRAVDARAAWPTRLAFEGPAARAHAGTSEPVNAAASAEASSGASLEAVPGRLRDPIASTRSTSAGSEGEVEVGRGGGVDDAVERLGDLAGGERRHGR